MLVISVDSAALVTELSKRTWQRRAAEGKIRLAADDGRRRAMIDMTDVAPHISIPMSQEVLKLLSRADAGDAASQSYIGQLFAARGKATIALHWVKLAANQEDPGAMQILGQMHADGNGVEQDDYLALMWVAKAAAHGHPLAREQVKGMKLRNPMGNR